MRYIPIYRRKETMWRPIVRKGRGGIDGWGEF
jgi:hypothetical protein